MSKKTLVSAITAALVVGAASTTFAAANPFSDVPADSWAYDAVSTLAADGVIDGYTDGTYKGQNTMTRYEMAQIVARAMAKTDVDKADKALVDKLAAEFAEELDNLGVRVADLEKKSDNVKWGGEVRYTYTDEDHDTSELSDSRVSGKVKRDDGAGNEMLFRLEPKAYVGNTGWTANARIDYFVDLNNDGNNNATDNDVTVDRIYVEGPVFGGATLQAGKLPVFTAQGLVFDDPISGAQISFGSDEFTTTVAGGRYSEYGHALQDKDHNDKNTADYVGVQFDYVPSDNLALNAGYTHLGGVEGDGLDGEGYYAADPGFFTLYQEVNGTNKADIWYVGGTYNFNDSLALEAEYAQNSKAEYGDDAWTATLNYKGADASDAGSWGAYAGYREIGQYSVPKFTYDDVIGNGYKGFVVGATYAPIENVVATLEYFDGKDMVADDLNKDSDANKFFGRVEFFF